MDFFINFVLHVLAVFTFVFPLITTIKSITCVFVLKDTCYRFIVNYWMYYFLFKLIQDRCFNDDIKFQIIIEFINIWLFYGSGNNLKLLNHLIVSRFILVKYIKDKEEFFNKIINCLFVDFIDLQSQLVNRGEIYCQPFNTDLYSGIDKCISVPIKIIALIFPKGMVNYNIEIPTSNQATNEEYYSRSRSRSRSESRKTRSPSNKDRPPSPDRNPSRSRSTSARPSRSGSSKHKEPKIVSSPQLAQGFRSTLQPTFNSLHHPKPRPLVFSRARSFNESPSPSPSPSPYISPNFNRHSKSQSPLRYNSSPSASSSRCTTNGTNTPERSEPMFIPVYYDLTPEEYKKLKAHRKSKDLRY